MHRLCALGRGLHAAMGPWTVCMWLGLQRFAEFMALRVVQTMTFTFLLIRCFS